MDQGSGAEYASYSKVWGCGPTDQPVVRNKVANCGRMVENPQAWTEQIIYELENLTDADGSRLVGGATALLKVKSGMVCKYVAEGCMKIMGG